MKLAPIVLFAYDRPDHLMQTLDALSKNIYASDSILYVFVDGPKNNASVDVLLRIKNVQKIVQQIKGFARLEYHFSDQNIGCRDSIIQGISYVLKKHESVIVMEDDIITSPAFLSYMNSALHYYANRPSVFSISGHSHSPNKFQVPADYVYDVFASPRVFNWGWGTWANRWFTTDWSMQYYDSFMKHPYEQLAFNRSGDDMVRMLIDERNGCSSAWDIQFTFHHFRNHAVSIVPCISYTYNIGLDGSGTHCYNSNVQHGCHEFINSNMSPKFLDVLYLDSRIMNRLYSAFCIKKRPFWQKAINTVARILGLQPPYMIKKKIYA